MDKPIQKTKTTVTHRIQEALDLLRALKVPQTLQNERSALTLLALLGMTPEKQWSEANAPMLGITEIMEVIAKHFSKKYAPNTRETVRRCTVHQFVQMKLVVANPDDPNRPVNSPYNRYQVASTLLKLAQTYGSPSWEINLKGFLSTAEGLQRLRPRQRDMVLIPVKLPDGKELKITAGKHNELIKRIVEEFCPRFTPDGVIIYVGDTGAKQRHFEADYLQKLGVSIDKHGKMPDVVIHHRKKDWLVLIEAVTSHGPIGMKRLNELKEIFQASRAGLVFVTAFPTRQVMMKYLKEVAWETEVWIADEPSHIIHFNGDRFLGPYE